jgi:hypothetical protein
MNRYFIAALACMASLPAAAQETREPRDFTGFWSPARAQHPMNEGLMNKLPDGTVVLDDASYVEFPAGEYGGLGIKPHALEAAESWQPSDAFKLANVCATPAVIYTMQGPFPIEIHQTEDVMVIKVEYFDQVRVIYMDGRNHPGEDAAHSNLGHSIGWWEGDELVVDTTHISSSTITNNGLDHSDQVYFVERFKLSEDGQTLMATQWFEDPVNLDTPGARFMQWTSDEGYVLPYACDPTFSVDYSEVDDGEGLTGAEFEVID